MHQIPLYALYFGYTRLIVPYVLRGNDPLAGLWSFFSSKAAAAGVPQAIPAGGATQEPAISKRQAKLQKRMDKGDPRVQQRQK
jgi:hypothetical protein